MQLTLPYPPSSNRYWRVFQGVARQSREAMAYKREVAVLAKQARVEPLAGDVALTVTVYRPRKVGDLDNRLKVLLDALAGAAYADDKQVREIHAYLRDDKHNPRVEVRAANVEEQP